MKQLLLDFNVNIDQESAQIIVNGIKALLIGAASVGTIIYSIRFFLETIVRKYINDNVPNLSQVEINARNKVRFKKIKNKYSELKFAFWLGLGALLLKLHLMGAVKLKEDRAAILAIFLMAIYILKNVDWSKIKFSEVTDPDVDLQLEMNFSNLKEDIQNK